MNLPLEAAKLTRFVSNTDPKIGVVEVICGGGKCEARATDGHLLAVVRWVDDGVIDGLRYYAPVECCDDSDWTAPTTIAQVFDYDFADYPPVCNAIPTGRRSASDVSIDGRYLQKILGYLDELGAPTTMKISTYGGTNPVQIETSAALFVLAPIARSEKK